MDQPLKSPGQSAMEDAFHRLFELSRTTPAPSLEERLDRLARLRAAVADNKARLIRAISAGRWAASARRARAPITANGVLGRSAN
jgi:coniferyl-aldehyde dehydrogenase